MKRLLAIILFPIIAWSQATVVQSPVPKFHSFLPNGSPNAAGCVYTFASGTSTPQATYTDFTGNTTNSNPVQLDGNGEFQIWITSAIYRFQVWSFGSGTLGANCGNGQQLYQIDGIKDTGLSAAITSLSNVVTINTPLNPPQLKFVTPAASNEVYNVPDPGGTGGNFIINPSGSSGTSNTLDCTLAGITCKRIATYFFRGGQCNQSTAAIGWDTLGGVAQPVANCITGTNVQKGVLGLPAAYTHIQQASGTSSAAGTVTTTYPATLVGGNGDLVVLSIAFNATTTVTGCTDGTNAYSQAKHIASGALSVDIWYFLNPTTKAAGTVLTCTFSAAATSALKWHEYTTVNTLSLDVTQSSTGTSTTASTGTTASLAQATELAFGAAGDLAAPSNTVATAGYTDHGVINATTVVQVDDAGIVTHATTGQVATFTLGSSQAWAGAIATFKANDGGPAFAQQTVALPAFFNSAQAINSNLKWVVSAPPVATSQAVLAAALVCTVDGATDDPVFNTDTTATVTVLTAGSNVISNTALNALAATGCAASNTMHYQIKRLRYNASDTYEGFIQVIGGLLQIGITQ